MKRHIMILATMAALGAQIIFGFSFMFTKISLNYASPMTVIADRYLVAFFCMTLVMLLTKQKIKLKSSMWKIILMALFQPVLYFLFETYGIKLTTSAFSSIMISLIPVVSMICGIFTLKEVPSPMQYVFSVISVIGVIIMTLSGKSSGTITFLGIILLIGAVFSSVFFNISSRKISGEFTVVERTYATTVIGLVAFLSVSLIENIHNPARILTSFASPAYMWSILYLGVLSSVVAFLLMNFANTYLPVAKTTVFANVTTVISVIAGMLFLDEKITASVIISTIMIIFGVTGVQMLSVKNKS